MCDHEIYTFEDEDGDEELFNTMDIHEAREYAQKHDLKIIANTYACVDSMVIDDFTPNAS